MHRSTFIVALSVLLAVVLYTGVGFFVWMIGQDESDREATLSSMQAASVRQENAARTHSILIDTTVERQALENLVSADVISIAGLIQDAGHSGGVTLSLSNAMPEDTTFSAATGTPISVVGFLVQGSGSFSSLTRALMFLETLPVPSSITRFDMERTNPDDPNSTDWNMSVYLRVLTTSANS